MPTIRETVANTIIEWAKIEDDLGSDQRMQDVWEAGLRFKNDGLDFLDTVANDLVVRLNHAFQGKLKHPLKPGDITAATTTDKIVEMIQE